MNMSRSQSPISLEYILLGFIYQRPIHGYDLYKKINEFEGISLIWKVKQGMVYCMLERLEEAGLITSIFVSEKMHINRKEYSITAKGKESFYTWVTTPVSSDREIRQIFLAKLFFCQKLSIEVSLDLIEQQQALCSTWLSDLLICYLGLKPVQQYEKMFYKYQIAQSQTTIDWLDYCGKEISNGTNPYHFSTLQQSHISFKSG